MVELEPTPHASQRSAVERFLAAYRPARLPAERWREVADDAVALVLRDNPATIERTRKAIEALAAAAAYLAGTSVPLTIENLVADTTLAGLDTARMAAGHGEGTRNNLRGRLRHLRAILEDVPSGTPRRPDGQRIATLPTAADGRAVLALLPADGERPARGAADLAAAVDAARARRRGDEAPGPAQVAWARARQFAASRGVHVDKRTLDALATHEVLAQKVPLCELVATYGLTRRDLDLALTTAVELPPVPDEATAVLLRG